MLKEILTLRQFDGGDDNDPAPNTDPDNNGANGGGTVEEYENFFQRQVNAFKEAFGLGGEDDDNNTTPDPDPDPDPDVDDETGPDDNANEGLDKAALAKKYKDRYQAKAARVVKALEIKNQLLSARADGRPFDPRFADFVVNEVIEKNVKLEDYLKDNPQFFEKPTYTGGQVVRSSIQATSEEQEYLDFINRQQ